MTDGSGVQKQAAAGKTTGSMSGRKPTVWAKHTRGGLFLRLQLSRAKSEQSRTAACGRDAGRGFYRAKARDRDGAERNRGAARRKRELQNPGKAERPLAGGMQEMSHSEKESIVWK